MKRLHAVPRVLLTLVALLVLTSPAVYAQQTEAEQQDLAKQATDPTASLMSFGFQDSYMPSFWGVNDTLNQFMFRPVIPFVAWGKPNILRVSMPFNTSTGPNGRGLQDVTLFDVVVFPATWGRWAAGAVANFAPDRGPGVDRFQLGPAIGFVANVGENLQVGLFNQNLFSGNVATTSLQPVVTYQLRQGWSVSAGDLQWIINWKASPTDFVALPIGFQIGKVTRLGSQPMRLFFNPQYNILNTTGQAKWTFTLGVALLVPSAR